MIKVGDTLPDVTLMDLRMPVLGGVEAIVRIRREFPNARIIVLTTFDGDEDIAQLDAGLVRGRAAKDFGDERAADLGQLERFGDTGERLAGDDQRVDVAAGLEPRRG